MMNSVTKKSVTLIASLAALGLIAGCGSMKSASQEAMKPVHQGSGAYITVSPASGPPGSIVTLSGFLPEMATVKPSPQGKFQFQGNIGFGGFRYGLTMTPRSTITWSSRHPGHFTTQFEVPKTAWLTRKGAHPLASGNYKVAIDCFGVVQAGCAVGADQATTTYHLTGGLSRTPHTYLALSPSHAKPGQTIQVSGWAPLTSIIGHNPFGYQLTWSQDGHTSGYGQLGSVSQSATGQIRGSFTVPGSLSNGASVTQGAATVALNYVFNGRAASGGVPSNLKGMVSISTAATAFRVQMALTWAQLQTAAPLREDFNLHPIAVAGNAMAFPGENPGQFWLRASAGSQWRAVSLSGIAVLSMHNGFPATWATGGKPSAYTVTLDQGFPESYFVTIASIKKTIGEAPPIFYIPYFTTDAGRDWSTVPIPQGFGLDQFGGFHVYQGSVYAYWLGPHGAFASEYTKNGGRTWSNGFLGCPSGGPCLRFGATLMAYPGMGVAMTQPVWRQNAQHQWVQASTVTTNMAASELVALSQGQSLLVNPGSNYPLELTTDGGQQWQDVALPTPPHPLSGGMPYQSLFMLSDGKLLANISLTSSNGWYVLAPGSHTWQAVPTSVLPATSLIMTVSGSNVWWSIPTSTTGTAPVVHVTNASQF